MEGIWKLSRKLQIKPKSSGPWQDGHPKYEMNEEGGVGRIMNCGHYDLEDDRMGNCRDEECRYQRLLQALKDGEAMKTAAGNIVWTPGFKIRQEKEK